MAEHLPKEILASTSCRRATAADTETAQMPLAEVEKRHILRVLEVCKGNKTQAAKALGISRLTLRNKVQDYGWSDSEEPHVPADAER